MNDSQDFDLSMSLDSLEDIPIDLTDPNMEVRLKVEWSENGKYHYIQIKKKEQLYKLKEHLGREYNIDPHQIQLLKNDEVLHSKDTMSSANVSVLDKIIAFKLQNAEEQILDEPIKTPGCNRIKIKLQTSDNNTLTYYLTQDDTMMDLIDACADDLKLKKDGIKIKFDGDFVNKTDTLKDLDIDEEVMMEAIL